MTEAMSSRMTAEQIEQAAKYVMNGWRIDQVMRDVLSDPKFRKVACKAARKATISWTAEDEEAVQIRAEELRMAREEARRRTAHLRRWYISEADSFREAVNSRLPQGLSVGIRCTTTELGGTAIDIALWYSDGVSMERPIARTNICQEIPTVDEIVKWALAIAKADHHARKAVEREED